MPGISMASENKIMTIFPHELIFILVNAENIRTAMLTQIRTQKGEHVSTEKELPQRQK